MAQKIEISDRLFIFTLHKTRAHSTNQILLVSEICTQ